MKLTLDETSPPRPCPPDVVFNLYAHRLMDYGEKMFATTEKPNGRFDKLILPDPDGTMRVEAPKGWGWYGIKWPVNPHFTGETAILDMLNQIRHRLGI